MAQSISLAMGAPSSFTTCQSWLVGCCIERYNSSNFHAGKAKTERPRYCIRSSSHSRQVNPNLLNLQTTKERIRELFNKVELSVSSYDTAWVAMVPSLNARKSPCFPECLNWLKENQLDDGSWGLVQSNSPILLKDALSSTLACIVALKRWNVGEDQINKGLCFMESNFDFATDKNQPSPIGFDIIFPGMLEYAKSLNLNLPFKQEELNVMLHERDLELSRCDLEQKEMYLAYISEGLNNSYDWNMVMKYKMKNGSILNSPSATAAALIHNQDAGCHDYLSSVLEKFGNAVPTAYPLDLYIRLSMVDTLERLGVTRHFSVEIQNVLDETYRYWLLRDEKIFMDVSTCALAFRVLRNNDYEVSSDHLAEITEEGYESLEVYQKEFSLGEENLTTVDILKRKLSTASNNLSELTLQEVEKANRFSYKSGLERISTRRNIEQYIVDNARTLKTTYRSSNISNEDYLRLAVEDYNVCQSIYREELKGVERWAVEKSLNKLKFARQKAAYGYLTAVSTFPSPELSDARISCAKSTTVVTVIDDFFDVQGSMDELVNLTRAVEKWNVNIETDCCSEEVRIILLAIKDIVNGTGDAAYKWQKRDITSHVIQIWSDMIKSMLTETIWARDGYVPTTHEYIENGALSFAVGPVVLAALYLIGPKLSEEIVQSSEYQNLYNLAGIYGRVMNDIMSVKRDTDAGRLNIVSLYQNNHAVSGIKEEEVIEEIKMFINNQERKMLNSVMKETGSIVPRDCKDAFWNTWNVVNLFYTTDDGFTGNSILDNVKEIIYEPVTHRLVGMNETEELLKSSPWKSNP